MKSLSSRRLFSRSVYRAFSLLELLVAIAIIAILAGILYPTSLAVMKQVKKARAENSASHLRNAISTYLVEYRKLPVSDSRLQEEDAEMTSGPELMNILCASPRETEPGARNPRGIVFYEDRVARPMGEGRFHSGLRYDSGDDITLYDPWGEPFRVVLDTDSNGRVSVPGWDSRNLGDQLVSGVLVWSAGPDGSDDAASDNITSW